MGQVLIRSMAEDSLFAPTRDRAKVPFHIKYKCSKHPNLHMLKTVLCGCSNPVGNPNKFSATGSAGLPSTHFPGVGAGKMDRFNLQGTWLNGS